MPFQIGPDVSWQASTDYRAFDGLVSAQEQNAISHAQIVNLYDSSLPCASTLRFLNVPCANSHSADCIGSCLLPGISPTSVVSTYLLHSSTYESDVFNAVGQATSNQSFSGPDYVRPVYDVFLGCFSHAKICRSPEAIQLIRGKLES